MEKPLKIAVCEDSLPDQQRLLSILDSSGIPVIPTVFSSGEALLQSYAPLSYDLILTDIYMTGMTGVETISKLRELDPDIPVAFVTSSPDHALEGYRLSVLKYIEKPYAPKEVEDMLMLARMNRDAAPALTITVSGRQLRIRFSQILCLEQQTHQVSVKKLDGSEVILYDKLSSLLPQLDPGEFYSPHKSYSVNLRHVVSIDSEFRCFVMSDGSRVPIRRESMHQSRKVLEEYLFRQVRGNRT